MIVEYNLELQGCVRNLQKKAPFLKFYPEMPSNNTEMRENNTTFGKKATFCQILQRAASDYRTLISSGLFLGLTLAPINTYIFIYQLYIYIYIYINII